MGWVSFHGRRAAQIENDSIRLTVTAEGGHIAEILHQPSGVNPLWIPPWPSIEPSTWNKEKHPEYGADAESKLLSGIIGHNLCLDLFGAPSPEEAAAGVTVHGEASILPYQISFADCEVTAACFLPADQLQSRTLYPRRWGSGFHYRNSGKTSRCSDRPIAWTQHVTLGPPFLEKGVTQFRAPGTKAHSLGVDHDFEWPVKPGTNGASEDMRVFTNAPASSRSSSMSVLIGAWAPPGLLLRFLSDD